MQITELTDSQLIACWRQTRRLIVHKQHQLAELRQQLAALEDQSIEYTVELAKRGFKVTLPIRID
jgi:hypothetical protein